MGSYIQKGDLLIVDGKHNAVALGSDYTQLYYDSCAREMAHYGLDYGVACGVVQVLVPENGSQFLATLDRVRKV